MYSICATRIRDSPIPLRLALRPAVFEIQAILRQVHQMTPNWPWILQGQMYSMYVLLLSPSPKFQFFSFHD